VRIPYSDEHGAEVAVRLQIALAGYDRFRWQQGGGRPLLYGLSRMPAYGDAVIVLVNGEADCWTLWFDDSIAQVVGLAGANSWDEERDAHHFTRFERIYLAFGNGPPRNSMLEWLGKSSIRDRAYVITLPESYPDLAALYQAAPVDFANRWEQLFKQAVSYDDLAAAAQRRERAVARNLAERLLRSSNILEEAYQTCRRELLIVDEERLVKLTYLVTTSRLLDRVVSLIIKGPSASGKSYMVEQVLRLFPQSAYLALTSMSEKALVNNPQPLEHRMLAIYEAPGISNAFVAYTIRTLLSEGRLRYMTPAGIAERQGPTGLIVTTTETNLHAENETRCLSLSTDDTPEHTAAIMGAQARGSAQGRRQARSFPSLNAWHALQDYLAYGEQMVAIPFAHQLSQLIPPVAVRLRRDFPTLLSLIEAHALLHQHTRARDDNGTVIADLADYEIVRELVGDLITQEAGIGIPAIVRDTRQAVATLLDVGQAHVTALQVARALHLDPSTMQRRVKLALEHGVLRNLETTRYRPARLVLGDDIPDAPILLPDVAELKAALNNSDRSGAA